MSDQFFWYVTRSAALVAWLGASASILIGLTTSSRILGRRPTVPWLVDLHRLFAALSVTFLLVHMVSLWLDSFVRFRFDDLLIPWVADVPGLSRSSVAFGVIAAWLLAAVQLSSLVKERLNERVWRSIHLLSFGTLILGTLHAVQAGSDVDNPIVLGLGMSILTAVVLATVVRIVRYGQQKRYAGAQPSGSGTTGQSQQPEYQQQPGYQREPQPQRPGYQGEPHYQQEPQPQQQPHYQQEPQRQSEYQRPQAEFQPQPEFQPRPTQSRYEWPSDDSGGRPA